MHKISGELLKKSVCFRNDLFIFICLWLRRKPCLREFARFLTSSSVTAQTSVSQKCWWETCQELCYCLLSLLCYHCIFGWYFINCISRHNFVHFKTRKCWSVWNYYSHLCLEVPAQTLTSVWCVTQIHNQTQAYE